MRALANCSIPPRKSCASSAREMRSHRGHDLSIPQFRTLTFVNRNPEISLSHLADHLGLTLPSTSKLVDGLVNQKIIIRHELKEDRRRLMLALTKNGEDILRVRAEPRRII